MKTYWFVYFRIVVSSKINVEGNGVIPFDGEFLPAQIENSIGLAYKESFGVAQPIKVLVKNYQPATESAYNNYHKLYHCDLQFIEEERV